MKKHITPAPKAGEVVHRKSERNDGWSNLVTLLGTSADKRTSSRVQWDFRPPEFYEQIYAGGGIPARIVDLIPDHALRNWVDWANLEDKTKMERDYAKEAIEEKCLELDVRAKFANSWKWGRAFGGGCLHIVTDTSDPASPLQKGEKVLALQDLSRWDLRILTTDIEYDFGSPNYGKPRIYYLNVQMGSQYKGYPIHWTRMVRFDGQLVPRRTYIRNNYWHDSILNRIYNSIRNYEMSNDAAAACLQDFNVDVYKLKNVANFISTGKENIIRDRVEMMNYSKSVINAMILDADQETYENQGRSMEGFADLLVHQANRLVADTDIPHTVLLGESPDGSNATGNSTSQAWYNFLKSEQEHIAKPKLNRLIDLIFPDMQDLRPKFKPLRVLDEIEQATVRKTTAETDAIYMDHGVVDPSEITDSRFGGDEYSPETQLDEEGREAGLIVPGSAGGGDFGGSEGGAIPASGTQPPEGEDVPGAASGTGEQNPQANHNMAKPGVSKKDTPNSGPEGDPGQTMSKKDISGSKPALDPSGLTPKDKAAALRKVNAEPGPSEPEPGNDMRGHEGEKKDITGRPPERHPAPNEEENPEIDRQSYDQGQSEFEPRNEIIPMDDPAPKTESFISQTMSEPMRDPKTDPHLKGPGIPNKQRTFLPTRGNGVTAQSGYDMAKDGGKDGAPREVGPEIDEPAAVGTGNAYDQPADKNRRLAYDSGIAATMEEFHKGTLKSSSGKKVTDPKQAAAIGYSEEKDSGAMDILAKPPELKRASVVIVKHKDKFLMGRRRDNGHWNLPGGHVEDGESHHQGGIRELKEETGLEAKRLKFIGGRMVEPRQGKSVHINLYQHELPADVARARVHNRKDPDNEFSDFRWVDMKGPLPDDIAGNLQHPNNVALDHLGLLK